MGDFVDINLPAYTIWILPMWSIKSQIVSCSCCSKQAMFYSRHPCGRCLHDKASSRDTFLLALLLSQPTKSCCGLPQLAAAAVHGPQHVTIDVVVHACMHVVVHACMHARMYTWIFRCMAWPRGSDMICMPSQRPKLGDVAWRHMLAL